MTIQPTTHLLTVADYLELGEPEFGYSELVEGRVLMSPSPAPRHNRGCNKMWGQLDAQLPTHLVVNQDIDVDLQLTASGGPGFVRRPDLNIVRRAELDRVDREGGVIRASEVLVVVEFVSPGSQRTDHKAKRSEYADAGIGHYWIVDLTEPVSLLACHLAGEFGYADGGTVTGVFTATDPCPVRLDLDALY